MAVVRRYLLSLRSADRALGCVLRWRVGGPGCRGTKLLRKHARSTQHTGPGHDPVTTLHFSIPLTSPTVGPSRQCGGTTRTHMEEKTARPAEAAHQTLCPPANGTPRLDGPHPSRLFRNDCYLPYNLISQHDRQVWCFSIARLARLIVASCTSCPVPEIAGCFPAVFSSLFVGRVRVPPSS